MKKLNRKGFTLVELLAVIVILAIVVGISIPAIANIINDSKSNAMGVALDAAEKYLSDQYGFMNVDYNSANTVFTNVITGPVTEKTMGWTNDDEAGLLKAMGFKPENVTTVSVTVSEDGIACVTVLTLPTTSEYYSTKYFTISDGVAKPNTSGDIPKANSKSC